MLFPLIVVGQTRGIDVSRYQGDINWVKVKKSGKASFVYIKATEGMTIQDPKYKDNIKKAREAGMLVGSYHLYSCQTTAYQQFDNFKKMVKKSQQDLIPVLDIEERHARNLYMARVDKLLELMEKEYGVRPMIYTCEHVYWKYFNNKKYSSYQIFIANYHRFPKTRFTLWQFTETGRIPGIKGNVDISEMHSSKKLKDILMPKPQKEKSEKDKSEKDKTPPEESSSPALGEAILPDSV